MHTVSVSGKYDANSSVGPISQHLVLFILLTFYLNYLPLWSVSDDQKLERKKTEKNKAKQTFLFKTRFELRDHPFTTGRIATKVIVISVSVFFLPFVKDERFAFSRDTRDDAVFTSLTGKIPQVNFTDSIFFVLMYTLNQRYCKVLEQKFAFALVSLMHPRIKYRYV